MADRMRHNEPGAPVNTPQHLVGQEPEMTEGNAPPKTTLDKMGRPTGPGT